MNAHNTTPNYMSPGHGQPITYVQAPPVSESRIDKAYITSIRGLLKVACLVNENTFCLSFKSILEIINVLFSSYSVSLHSFVSYQHHNVMVIMSFLHRLHGLLL